MLLIFVLFVLFQNCAALIYGLNDSDYARMPPLFHLDNYEECFDEPDSMYCLAEFALVSDEPSELLTMTQEFTGFLHYNHTVLRYGFCMKKTCSNFYEASESDLDLRSSLEACTNETIYKKYKLKTRLSNEVDCSKRDRDIPIDNVDLAVGVVCMVILMLNLIGSLCDRYLEKGKDRGGLRFLYCFSVFRNWKKLVASPGKGQDSRLKALRGIHGIRSLNTVFVISAHASFSGLLLIVNTKYLEDLMHIKVVSIVFNGTLIMQTFFVISSFLLVYNWLISSEKHKPSWKMLPKKFIIRWLRLTPSYGLIIALTATWFRRLASGPYWQKIVYIESRDCRTYWWRNILYINNYVFGFHCMPQTWSKNSFETFMDRMDETNQRMKPRICSMAMMVVGNSTKDWENIFSNVAVRRRYLAADTQLYIMGIIIFLICRTSLTRKLVLSILFVIGIIVPALQTYYQRLNGILLASPETAINLFMDDETFKNVFINGHTNLSGLVIGMAIAYMIYDWQKAGGNPKQFWKYRYLYWSTFFLALLICFSGCIFYADGPPQPVYVHMLYAAFMKPIFGIIMAIIIAGIIIQFEGIYRTVLEWQPFTYIGRLSFSAYLLHIVFVRTEVASIVATQRVSLIGTGLKNCTLIISIFIAAFFFWMLVESPFANLVGAIFRMHETHAVEENKEAVKEPKKTEDDNGIDMSQTKIGSVN